MTDTAPEVRGGFPDVKPVEDAPAELGPFVAALRRLQDLTVSTKPDPAVWATATAPGERLRAAGRPPGPGDRSGGRPGADPARVGPSLLPPWMVTESGPDGVRMAGHFTASHIGGNRAVHGGMIPLFYDWLFGMVVSTADIRPTRTAYLHVDYRNITPIDQPLSAQGRITKAEGRKVFIDATMTGADGTLLSEANGLMVRLLPHQP